MSDLSLDPKTTAVIAIDLQKGIVRFPASPHSAESVVANAAKLLDAARKAGSPVVLVHVGFSPDWGDALKQPVDQPMAAGEMPKDWAELVPELKQQPTDIDILKKQWGAFYGTDLDLQLRRRGIKTVVLCGIATEFGVESTGRGAWEHGYSVVFAEDAMTGFACHASSIANIFPRIGRVRATSAVVAGFGAGDGA